MHHAVSVYVAAFTGTHCAYPRRDGQAELTWVAGNIPRCRRSPIQVLTWPVTTLPTEPNRHHDIILATAAMIEMAMSTVLSSRQSHCRSSSGSVDECSTTFGPLRRRSAYWQPQPFTYISHLVRRYSFHHPTEGRRLS